MYSLIILFISVIPNLLDIKSVKNNLLSLIITSILFAYVLLGFISLILISIGQSRFPVLFISIIILIITLIKDKEFFKKYNIIKNHLLEEFKFLKITYLTQTNKKKSWIILVLFILITLSSIGPINHPDALDYHVGYIYQYWLKKGFFVDNGLHQGLLGIGDYANLSFIQENTIWLIRCIQILILPFVCLFLYTSVRNKNFIIAFLSSSTFLQWSTIGKPLFISEASASIAYIFWKSNKNYYSKKLLILCLISCIAIKISALIICAPIVADIVFEYKKKISFNKLIKSFEDIIFQKENLIPVLSLLVILISRYFINGNFAYPLLTEIFNANDKNIVNFAEYLSSYNRNNFFPLNIFFPLPPSTLSNVLSPGIFILIISLFFIELKKINQFKKVILFNNSILLVAFSQLIFLFIFCQGRSDYYAMPVILFIYSSNDLENLFKVNIFRITLNFSIYLQLILVTFLLLVSISQNFMAIVDYKKSIEFTSSGYGVSKYMDSNTNGNVYQNLVRDARFYYPKNYISQEKILSCFQENEKNSNYKEYCLNANKISKFISKPEFLKNSKNFICDKKTFIIGARNPKNREEQVLEICNKK